MTTEEKAKRYDELFVKASRIYIKENDVLIMHTIEDLFPELKESGDERIRKELIKFVKSRGGFKQEYIAWLEKQGEQKSVDKAEPKFYKGDWISGYYTNYKVLSVNNEGYVVEDVDGNKINILFENEKFHHLWTIQDAKDGDVLVCNEEILLFKSYSVQDRISLYCWYNGRTNNFHSKEVDDTLLTTRNKICPATKEQHDLLFQKMREAGYEWDAENKKLKKIEQKTDWSEQDEINWLKSLKERYTWKPSEEQMKALKEACDEHWEPDGLDPLYTLYQDLKKLREE